MMLCMACGAEMHLISVVEDNTMMVPGYEHHTFLCSACPEMDRRLLFRDRNAPLATLDPDSTFSSAQPNGPGVWDRVLGKFRGKR
jgi:hypothetical protein